MAAGWLDGLWHETAMIEETLLSSMHVCWYSASFVYIGIEMRCDIRQSLGFGVLHAPGCVKRDVSCNALPTLLTLNVLAFNEQ